ncbi:MAG: hypothetical protein DWQ19_10665 [Crenarchaeota archaeon]|nr:MAG: hypothetical protein DWQ19_10665 [Thermoproteota archaeon]
MIYEDLREQISVLRGQIAETFAKSKILQEKMIHGHDIQIIDKELSSLEYEMKDHFSALGSLEEQL